MVGERERAFLIAYEQGQRRILSSSNGEASMRFVLAERCVWVMIFT